MTIVDRFWPFLTIFECFWSFLTAFNPIDHFWPYITHVQEGRVLVVCRIFYYYNLIILLSLRNAMDSMKVLRKFFFKRDFLVQTYKCVQKLPKKSHTDIATYRLNRPRGHLVKMKCRVGCDVSSRAAAVTTDDGRPGPGLWHLQTGVSNFVLPFWTACFPWTETLLYGQLRNQLPAPAECSNHRQRFFTESAPRLIMSLKKKVPQSDCAKM